MSVEYTAATLKEALTSEGYEKFWDDIWELDEDYGLPLTNNEPRMQDGRQLHEVGDFGMDVLAICARVINSLSNP